MKAASASMRSRLSLIGWERVWIAAAGIMLALGCGLAVAQGGTRRAVALAVAGLFAALPLLHAVFSRRGAQSVMTVELPLVVLLVSNLVLRVRSTQDIAAEPLDAAAQFRLALMVFALGLGVIALMSPANARRVRVISPILGIYAVYVAVVFLGAPLSVDPPLTFYRGLELAAALTVLAGARRSAGADASRRLGDVLYWFAIALLISVWIGVVLFPETALNTFENPDVRWTFQVNGVLPELSSNTVGMLGVLVTVWSIARVDAGSSTRARGYPVAVFGCVCLLAAQYRTGYAALVLAAGVWLLIRHRWGLVAAGSAIAIGIVLLYPSLITGAEPYVLRGQTPEEAAELSSRITFWRASIPVWQESPLLGRGLLTGTRYEVLGPLGLDTTSSIHSTWVEALVGTGVVGLVLLIAVLWALFRRAIKEAREPFGWKVPLMLLIAFAMRSLTGSTFDSFSYYAVVILWLASSVDDWPLFRRQQRRVLAEPVLF